MKITEMRRSTRKAGGWLINCNPRREFRHILEQISYPWKHLPQFGIYWLSEEAVNALGIHVSNYAEACKSAGREQQRPPQTKPAPSSPYAALGLLNNAPIEVVEAAYRALAKKYHPDLGGDETRMKRINLAYEAIKTDQAKRA